MPTFICKAEGRYFNWSTIVDAPVSEPMTLDEFKVDYAAQFGSEGMRTLPERLERVEATGCSSRDGGTFESLVSCNRFGPNESELTLEQVKAWARGEQL